MIRLSIAAMVALTIASSAWAAPAGQTMLIHHKVADYAKWRAAYDADQSNRDAAGLTDCRVQSSTDDADEVFITCDVADMAKAKAFAASPRLRDVMMKAGVTAKPDLYFLGAPR